MAETLNMTVIQEARVRETWIEESRVVFSASELVTIRETIRDTFAMRLDVVDLDVWFDGALVDERMHGELRLTSRDQAMDLQMEAATEVNVKDAEDLLNSRAHIFEFLVAMLEEWVDDGALRSPNLDWETFTYESRSILYRGRLDNRRVDALADAFLREHGFDPEGVARGGDSEDDWQGEDL